MAKNLADEATADSPPESEAWDDLAERLNEITESTKATTNLILREAQLQSLELINEIQKAAEAAIERNKSKAEAQARALIVEHLGMEVMNAAGALESTDGNQVLEPGDNVLVTGIRDLTAGDSKREAILRSVFGNKAGEGDSNLTVDNKQELKSAFDVPSADSLSSILQNFKKTDVNLDRGDTTTDKPRLKPGPKRGPGRPPRTDKIDPAKPADADVNRAKQNVKLRLHPEVREMVDRLAAGAGLDRNAWMTAVFLKAAVEAGESLSPEYQQLLLELEPK